MLINKNAIAFIMLICWKSVVANECGLMPCVGTSVKKLKEMHYRRIVTVESVMRAKASYSSKDFDNEMWLTPFRAEKEVDGFNVEVVVSHDQVKVCAQSIYVHGVKVWNKNRIENVLKEVTGLKFNLPTKEFSYNFKTAPPLNKEQKQYYSPFDFLYYENDQDRIGLFFHQSSLCKRALPEIL